MWERNNLRAMWTNWFSVRRLQTKLLIWTAVILIASVALILEVRTQLNIRNLELNLRDRAETLVRALDRSLMLRSRHFNPLDVEERLRDLVEVERTLTRLDVVDGSGSSLEIAVSSSASPNPLISSIPAVLTTEIRQTSLGREMVTVYPMAGTPYALLAVNSMEFVDDYRGINRTWEPVFGAVLVLVVISLMHVMYQRIVSKRFDELLDGIHKVSEGDHTTTIPDTHEDEIGIIARTLNALLSQVQSFNDDLRREVETATAVLNKRNIALEDTTREMLSMQRQLVQAERLAATGQMAAAFAHEIGSPMSSLSAHVQLLLEDPSLSPEQHETLRLIREQIQSIVQIVNDLLRSARRGPSDFVPADVNEILTTVLKLVQPKLMSQKIHVETNLNSVPKVRAYPLYLQEAFLNLVNNASDAMPDGGHLELQTWFDAAADRVNIRIADTGPGIDPGVVEHIFEHFVTTKNIGAGTGLGLGIVKEIVTGHRGNLVIAPANGSGTAAHVTFPPDSAGRVRV